ncbi:hypothetical protein ACH5A3_36405 [Streptomyces echinatus]|uniref:hypothetical protein n=1 Tax=Streptomyces echinatus TaxID=67293 RepID=UPI0037B9CBA9
MHYWPAGDLHACQDPNCRYAQGISAEALAAADQGLPLTYDPAVFSRLLAARRADPDRVRVPALPIGVMLRESLVGNRPASAVPDAELQRLLEELPADPAPPGYDEDQALGRLALTAETLRMALDVREVEAVDNLAGHDGELHHLARRVLESIAAVLAQHEPSITDPATEAQPEEG